jgi:hypothetical protein
MTPKEAKDKAIEYTTKTINSIKNNLEILKEIYGFPKKEYEELVSLLKDLKTEAEISQKPYLGRDRISKLSDILAYELSGEEKKDRYYCTSIWKDLPNQIAKMWEEIKPLQKELLQTTDVLEGQKLASIIEDLVTEVKSLQDDLLSCSKLHPLVVERRYLSNKWDDEGNELDEESGFRKDLRFWTVKEVVNYLNGEGIVSISSDEEPYYDSEFEHDPHTDWNTMNTFQVKGATKEEQEEIRMRLENL